MLAPKVETVLWARRPGLAAHIDAGSNPDYLPGFELPDQLTATTDVRTVIQGADVIV
ncbi:MAG TPA: glycerol-3-phosphate dehydrogenase, partial [Planctomycetaceae bacterium]|nr:glycerol-3-phosphate dehydrogenase [Planctomycetaceae bacterium]